MNTLLLDCGNTLLKIQILRSDYSASEVFTVALENFSTELSFLFKTYQNRVIRSVFIAAVCKKIYQEQLKAHLEQYLPNTPSYWLKASAYFKTLKNGYEQPEKLGIDRWLGLIALYQQQIFPAWLISIGTAITVDYLDEKAEHNGGWIIPGLPGMKAGLEATTALNAVLSTPILTTETDCPLAKNTEQGIVLGIYNCLLHFFENLPLMRPGKMIFTGGDGKWFAERQQSQYIPNLVLTGLQAWQKHHQ
jgi:type III pantothenate kinase